MSAVNGESLEDRLLPEDVSGWNFLTNSFRMMVLGPAFFVGAIVTVPVLIGEISIWIALAALVCVQLFFGCCYSIAAFGRGYTFRHPLPRAVKFSDGNLVVTTRSKEKSFPIAEINWWEGKADCDEFAMMTAIKHGLTLAIQGDYFAVGRTPIDLEVWRALLTLHGCENRKPLGCITTLAVFALTMVGCALAGTAIGYLAYLATGLSDWMAYLGALGFVDGIFISVPIFRRLSFVNEERDTGLVIARSLLCAVLGFSACNPGGFTGGTIVAIANGLLAYLVLRPQQNSD